MTNRSEDYFLNKDVIDLLPKIEDQRGYIQPICDLNSKNVSIIYSQKKIWRANHYHKKDWHFIYVMQGQFEYYYRNTNSNEKVKKKNIKKGELLFTGNMVDHAMYYTEETIILVVSKNPRDQKTYEEDTVRINFMNDQNRF